MGLFSRKQSVPADVSQPPAVVPSAAGGKSPVLLPSPRLASSREEAGALLEEVGDIQRRVVDGAPLEGVGEEIVARVEGASIFFMDSGADPAVVFDELIAPISEWGMGRLMGPALMDSDSREGVAGQHAFDVVCALRTKYQHLNPENN